MDKKYIRKPGSPLMMN